MCLQSDNGETEGHDFRKVFLRVSLQFGIGGLDEHDSHNPRPETRGLGGWL